MFRASSCPSSGATATAVAASGLPSERGDMIIVVIIIGRIKNEQLKEITGMKGNPDIIDIIERKILQWCGHVKMIQEDRIPQLIIEWILRERRKGGRPRET
jgi:hypothetical protein